MASIPESNNNISHPSFNRNTLHKLHKLEANGKFMNRSLSASTVLDRIYKNYRIILDDASHAPSNQIRLDIRLGMLRHLHGVDKNTELFTRFHSVGSVQCT